MTTFILFISIIINIVAIFAIIILYMRQNRLLHIEKDQKKALKDMEEMFSSYLIEMRDENENFIKRVQILGSKQATKNTLDDDEECSMDMSMIQMEQKNDSPILTAFMKNHAEKTYQSAMTKKDATTEETQESDFATLPLEKQVLFLEKEGLSIEQIASKLHKGKTEIELLLKFRQKM